MGSQGAVYFETLSDASGSVTKEDWDKLRVGMACTTTDTLAEIKKEIEKLCSSTSCDYEKVKAAIQEFHDRLEVAQKQVEYFSATLRAQ